MYHKEQLKWNIFFRKMAQGKIPRQPKFYCIDDHVTDDEINQEGSGTKPTTQFITPTQQHVQQAEAEVRRHLQKAEAMPKKRKTICFCRHLKRLKIDSELCDIEYMHYIQDIMDERI